MGLMDALENVGYVVDTPRALTHGLVAKLGDAVRGRPIRDNWRASGREMLESLGVLGPNQEGLDAGDVLGFGAEMALDPLNLLGAGVGMKLLGKYRQPAAKIAESLGKVDEAPILAERVAQQVPEVMKSPVMEPEWQRIATSKRDPSKYAMVKEYAPYERVKAPAWERPDLKPGEGPFYSRLERAVEALQGDRLKTSSVMKKIKAYPEGVSQDEIDWTGVADYLKGKQAVSKADLLEHVRKNRPRVNMAIDDAYSTYVQPGDVIPGSYRVDLFKQASKASDLKPKYTQYVDDAGRLVDKYGDGDYSLTAVPNGLKSLSTGDEYVRLYRNSGANTESIGVYDRDTARRLMPELFDEVGVGPESEHFGGHFGVLAHGRSTKRNTTLGKMLLGEEQQSDWFQKAREHGFQGDPIPTLKWDADDGGSIFRSDYGDVWRDNDGWFTNVDDPNYIADQGFRTPEDAMAFVQKAADREIAANRMPRAPMSESWPELVLKKQIHDAASDPSVKYFGLPSGENVQKIVGGELKGQQQFYDKDQVERANQILRQFGVGMEDSQPLYDAANTKVADRLTRELEKLSGIRKRLLDDEPVGGLHDLPSDAGSNLGDFIPGADLQLIPESKLDKLDMIINRRIDNAGLHPHDVYDPMSMSDGGDLGWGGDLRSTIASALRSVRPKPASKVAKITPEMRQEILRKGFPLMSVALASLLGPQLMDEGA